MSHTSDTDEVFGPIYARLYDALYADKPYAEEVRSILAVVARHGCRPTRVVDFGCGTGRHLVELARAGLEVVGVDPSASMLAQARERLAREGVAARLELGRAATIKLAPRHELALMLFAVLSYHDGEELERALASVRTSLVDGGLLIADPWYGPAVLADPPGPRTRTILLDDERWVRESTPEHDPLRQTVCIDFSLRRLASDAVVARERHHMRYFFPRELELMLRRAGFELLELGRYPDGSPLEPAPNVYPVMIIARAC